MISSEPPMRRCRSSERVEHHPVVVAVGDEGGLGDLRQIIRRAASPLLDRLQLRPEGLQLDRGVMASFSAELRPIIVAPELTIGPGTLVHEASGPYR
jgi:hypothetical protein